MEFSYEIIDHIRQLHGAAKAETQRLKAETENALQTERFWADFEQFLAKG